MDSKKLTKCLFFIYFVALVWIILFKMQLPFAQLGYLRSVNLIPFAGSTDAEGRLILREIVENVLIFIPFGVFCCMLGQSRSWLKRIAPVFFTSLTLELLQYVLGIGVTDITDLLGNTLGGVLGMGVFGIFSKLCREKVYTVLNAVTLTGAAGMCLLIGILFIVN